MTSPSFVSSDITVSIATIDRADFFAAALDSVMEHSPADVSLQIVLNEATDECKKIAEQALARWTGPTKLVEVEKRLTITQSHQRAVDECSTKLLNFMGDDDLCLAPRFHRVLDAFNTIENLQIVGSWVVRAGGDARKPKLIGKFDIGPPDVEEWEAHRRLGVPVQVNFPSAVFLVQGIYDIGGLEDRFDPGFDKAMIGKMGQLGPVIALQERDFAFRIHNSSDSATNFFKQTEAARYGDACLAALDASQPEPTLEQFNKERSERPLLERIREKQNVRSRFYFRRAGASWANDERGQAVIAAVQSALSDPFTFFVKLKEQRGRSEDFRLG